VNILDRYTSRVSVVLDRYQLVGITALLIASKYEEIHPFSSSDASYITDHAFDKDEVNAMEKEMLTEIEFEVTFPTHLAFLSRVTQLAEISHDPQACCFAMYLCELALVNTNMLSFRPSLIATASVFLTCKMLKVADPYPTLTKMRSHIGCTEQEVRHCFR